MNVLDSGRGHGEFGLRGNMKLFEELISGPNYEKRVFVEARPSVLVSPWTFDQGDTFVAPFEQFFNGGRLDVVAVTSLLDTGLVRVESLAVCRATPGTFFYDLNLVPAIAIPIWDDATTVWDGPTVTWDQTSFLYVHLFGGEDPNSTRVTVKLGIFFANKASIEAHLGVEKILNGKFEDDFTDWTLGLGNAALTIETANAIRTGRSARWDLNGVTDNFRDLSQSIPVVEGQAYRISTLYSVSGSDAFLQVIVITPGLEFAQGSGRDYKTLTGDQPNMSVFNSNGKVRRLIYDFIAKETGTYEFRLRGVAPNNPSAPPTWDDAVSVWDGGLTWDDLGIAIPVILADEISIKPIYRFQYHEPRLTQRSAIETQQGARDVFLATTQVGRGTIDVATDETRFMERLVSELNFESHEMIVKRGGAFTDGEELLIDDFTTPFTGRVRRSLVGDDSSTFELEDVRSFIQAATLTEKFTLLEFPDLDTTFEGQVRRLWFGPQTNITPARISLSANDYGVYELSNPTIIPNGVTSIDQVFSYEDSGAAAEEDPARRILLTLGIDYSVDLLLSQFTILSDPQIIEITVENDAIDYSANGTKVAFVIPAIYTPRLLAQAIEDAMNLVGGGTFDVTYNESTHDFTIDRTSGSGNFNLLTQSGVNKGIAIWGTIGFTQDADKTGSQVYTTEEPIFVAGENEAKHILRTDGVGTRDTVPGGDFTGVSGDPIQKGTDIVRFIVSTFVSQEETIIDDVSFTAARTLAPDVLGVYIKDQISLNDFFGKIALSNRATFVVRGDGLVLYFVTQPGVVTALTVPLVDNDLIRFSMDEALDDVYGTIEVQFGENPSTGVKQTSSQTTFVTEALFSRPNTKIIDTFLTNSTDAALLALNFLNSVDSPPRIASFTTKVLVDRVEGQKVRLTRRKGIGPDGQLNDELFRILMVRTRTDSALANVIAVEDT